MKRTGLIFVALFLSLVQAWADPALKKFTERADSSLVAFSYRFTVPGKIPMKGSGTALVQGDAFFLEGNGVEVWCDGKERWTLDREGCEAVVEAVGAGGDFATDPALLVSSVDEGFSEVSSGAMAFQGKTLHGVVLSPKVDAGNVTRLVLYFQSERLCGLEVTVEDGTRTEFVLSDLRFSARGPLSRFRFDASTLDASWVLTDLR